MTQVVPPRTLSLISFWSSNYFLSYFDPQFASFSFYNDSNNEVEDESETNKDFMIVTIS